MVDDMSNKNHNGEGKYIQRTHTTVLRTSALCKVHEVTALHTIPVIVKNRNKRVTVNALLDDTSTKTYVNADLAAELGIQRHMNKVNINVLNGQVDTFDTMPVELGLESLDGGADVKLRANRTDKVTGHMQMD